MLAIADRWWVPTLRGTVAIGFGLLAIVWPGLALMSLVALFGAFALMDGVIALVGLVTSRTRFAMPAMRNVPWWMQLLVGVTGLAAGIATFAYPGITSMVLLTFIAAYALVVGVAQIVAAIRQRKQSGAVALGIGGAIAALFGVGILVNPGIGAVAISWLIGIFAIAMGGALVAMGLSLRNVKEAMEPRLTATMMPEERAKVEK